MRLGEETDLAGRKTWAGRAADAGGLRIRCLSGCLWVTREGDAADFLLRAGEEFRTEKPGLVVAEALVASRVRIAARGKQETRWRAWLRALLAESRGRLPGLGGGRVFRRLAE